jgi:hypothetical protein
MLYVVAEGPSDCRLIERLLEAADVEDRRVLSRGGRSAAISLATSLRVMTSDPVVLVLDADTMDDARIREQERIVSDLLERGGPGAEFKVVFVKPEIEAVYFSAPEWLEQVLGRELSEADLARAEGQPRRVLDQFRNGLAEDALPDRLDDEAVSKLSRHPAMADLIEFARKFVPAYKI